MDDINDKHDPEKRSKDVLTVNDVAELLQVSRQHVYELIKRGEIKGARVGKRWRFSKRLIMEWIERESMGGDE